MSSAVYSQLNNCNSCHAGLKPEQIARLQKKTAAGERGLGVMDKGQISNYLGNYGVISNFHEYFNNAIHWPADANTETQYSFGLGLFVLTIFSSVLPFPGRFLKLHHLKKLI